MYFGRERRKGGQPGWRRSFLEFPRCIQSVGRLSVNHAGQVSPAELSCETGSKFPAVTTKCRSFQQRGSVGGAVNPRLAARTFDIGDFPLRVAAAWSAAVSDFYTMTMTTADKDREAPAGPTW